MTISIFVDHVATDEAGRCVVTGRSDDEGSVVASWPMNLVIAGRPAMEVTVTDVVPSPSGVIGLAVTPAIATLPSPACEIRLTQTRVPIVVLEAFVLDTVGALFPDTDTAAQTAIEQAGFITDWRAAVATQMGIEGEAATTVSTWLRRHWASAGRDPLRSPTVEAWARSIVELNWVVPPTGPVKVWRELQLEVLDRVANGSLGQDAIFIMFRRYEALTTADRLLIDQELARQTVDALTDGDRFDALALIAKYKILEATPALQELHTRLETSDQPTERFEANRVTKIIEELETHGDAPRPLDIPPELIGRTDRTKAGFLYDVAGPYPSMDDVPLNKVRRAFKLNNTGMPTGEVEVNTNYKD